MTNNMTDSNSSHTSAELKRTPLYDQHVSLGARMVDFGGWEMPVQYQGVLSEHKAVRNRAGLFDVCHMGEVEIEGKDALNFLQHLVTNNVEKLQDGQALYSPMCYENGTIVDDLIIYRMSLEKYFLIINASNITKDVEWMKKNSKKFDIAVHNISDDMGLVALQGPRAQELLQPHIEADLDKLSKFSFVQTTFFGRTTLIARTGYTGEDGFEICANKKDIIAIWKSLIAAGATPCGLGARDTLRLECAMMLYGNDIDDTTTPLEAPLSWTVFWEKEFTGKTALMRQKHLGVQKKLAGVELLDRGIARHGYPITDASGKQIGIITSGTQSPTLKKSIALAYIPPQLAKVGEKIHVKIRDNLVLAIVVKLPFYKRN